MVLRYVFRHLRRSLLKSLLCLLLAGALIAALGQFIVVVQQAHETVDEMYAELEVDALLAGANGTMGEGMPLIALNSLLETEFSESFYVNATSPFYWVDPTGNTSRDDVFYTVPYSFYGVNDPVRFIEATTEFLDGYDGSEFAESREQICIISRTTSDRNGFALGDEVMLSCADTFERQKLNSRLRDGSAFKVVGIFETTSVNNDVVIPLWTLEELQGSFYYRGEMPKVTYAEFRIRNDLLRDDEAYRARPTAILENSSNPEISRYTLRYLDDELRNVVRPLESNANTLRLLLPIIAAVVLIIGAAIPALVVVQTSKDAAIMRVLGMTKAKVRAILTLEQALLCLAGLAIGVTALTIVHGDALAGDKLGASVQAILLGLAAGYLVLAVAASAVSSVVVSARKPLELLQAKE